MCKTLQADSLTQLEQADTVFAVPAGRNTRRLLVIAMLYKMDKLISTPFQSPSSSSPSPRDAEACPLWTATFRLASLKLMLGIGIFPKVFPKDIIFRELLVILEHDDSANQDAKQSVGGAH